MKNLTINYKVFNDKINDKSIILLSDLHDYSKISELSDDIINNSPDLVVIAGDILQSKKYIYKSSSFKNLKYFLEKISEYSPVILGLGNHDLYNSSKESLLGYKELENARNGMIFPLNNESIILDNIKITEFHPSHKAFSPSLQENGNALIEFCNDYNNSNLEVSKIDKLFNILICHNPKIFSQAYSIGEQLNLDLQPKECNNLSETSNKLGNYDLVLSGHLHNGYINTSKIIKNPAKYMDKGYWEMPIEKNSDGKITNIRPWIFKKTDMCRGTIYVAQTENKIIELCDGTYYYKKNSFTDPFEVNEKYALDIINTHKMIPIVISGGVNKYFNLPIDNPEITQVKVLKKK